jgi:hypothetical protein
MVGQREWGPGARQITSVLPACHLAKTRRGVSVPHSEALVPLVPPRYSQPQRGAAEWDDEGGNVVRGRGATLSADGRSILVDGDDVRGMRERHTCCRACTVW